MRNLSYSRGYILILALTMLSLVMILVTGLFNRTTPYLFFDATAIKREKAKLLALGGLQIAMSQLEAFVPEPKDKQQGNKKGPSVDEQRKIKLFNALVPSLNRWQNYTLSKEADGIKGSVAVAISCEQGKLNINELFDFSSKKFIGEGKGKGDMRKLVEQVFAQLEPFTNKKNLFGVFEKFLKQRQYKLHEVTELLRVKEFQDIFAARQFYEPSMQNAQIKKGKKPTVYLTDLFTVWSGDDKLGVWVLSDSICALFGFKRASESDVASRAKVVQQAVEQKAFSEKQINQLWPKGPQGLYGKELGALPRDLQPLIRASFEPDIFSVISRGTVGSISQKIFAIIERREPQGDRPTTFAIRRLYWL